MNRTCALAVVLATRAAEPCGQICCTMQAGRASSTRSGRVVINVAPANTPALPRAPRVLAKHIDMNVQQLSSRVNAAHVGRR